MSSEPGSTNQGKKVYVVTTSLSERFGTNNEFNQTQVFTNERKAKSYMKNHGQEIQRSLGQNSNDDGVFYKENDDHVIVGTCLNEVYQSKGTWAIIKLEKTILNGMIRK